MSLIHNTLTLPSKLMVYIGNILIGDPKKLGIDATAAELYSKEVDRPFANQQLVSNAGEWSQMMRNYQVDYMRRKMFGRLCIYSSMFILVMSLSGQALTSGANFVVDTKNKVVGYYDKQNNIKRVEGELKDRAEKLKSKFKNGEITEEEFRKKAAELEEELKFRVNVYKK